MKWALRTRGGDVWVDGWVCGVVVTCGDRLSLCYRVVQRVFIGEPRGRVVREMGK